MEGKKYFFIWKRDVLKNKKFHKILHTVTKIIQRYSTYSAFVKHFHLKLSD